MHKFGALLLFFASVEFSLALSEHPITVIIGFDGFAADYLHKGLNPVLNKIGKHGIRTHHMHNIYPTKTFVNFFAIGTGLYAETHGVLANSVFNEKGECIEYGEELFHYNENVIPLWTLNELTHETRHSGCYMYPGSDFSYRNTTCTHFQKYDKTVHWIDRIDTVIGWLLDEEKPANLIFVYFEQPDSTAHYNLFESQAVQEQIQYVDRITEYFIIKLVEHKIYQKINYIILSDHGMARIKTEEFINVTAALQPGTYTRCGTSPALQILPKQGYEQEVYQNLTKLQQERKNFKIYSNKNEIPNHWNWANNKRNIGYYIVANPPHTFEDGYMEVGNHGFPPEYPPMRAIFMARGPLFLENHFEWSIRNIDIYPLLVEALNMTLLPDQVPPNGTISNFNRFLANFRP